MEKVINPGMANPPAFALAFHPASPLGINPGMPQNMKLPLNHPRLNNSGTSTASGEARTEVANEYPLLSAATASAENLTVPLVRILF